jgi:hypothetical protein
MKNYIKKSTGIMLLAVMLLGTVQLQAQKLEKNVTVIELTQTTGEFVTKELNLKPGKYQFRVVNDNVEKDLGFVIQKAKDKDGDVMKTAVSNSFTTAYIKKGEAQYTGVVELSTGEYVYSCPLNPTPHYRIVVK